MRGYNFTERVRKALSFSRAEAVRLHHEYVGTEHVLLGLLREGEGVASHVIANLGVKPDEIQARVEGMIKAGRDSETVGPDLPYTSRAKKVLEFAMTEARELGHAYVGTEHLLLGLLREEKGIAAQVLVGLGVTLDKARPSVLEILGTAVGRKSGGVQANAYALEVVRGSSGNVGARLLLTISAAFAVVIGLMLIFNARGFEAPIGIVIDDYTETIAQAQGAILLGLGIINWLSRGARDRAVLWAVMYGNFVVQAVSFAIVLRALSRGLIPAAGAGAAAMHVVLGVAFAWQLVQLRRSR
jgi:hypothetical protein